MYISVCTLYQTLVGIKNQSQNQDNYIFCWTVWIIYSFRETKYLFCGFYFFFRSGTWTNSSNIYFETVLNIVLPLRYQIYMSLSLLFTAASSCQCRNMLLRSSHGCAINTFRLIQLVAVICALGRVTGQGENRTQSPAQVVQDLLIRHGDNSTITVPQLRALLELLSQGQQKEDGVNSTAHSPTTTPAGANSSKVRGKNRASCLFTKT